ncbi:hypothetical protein AMTR_s00119p00121220 [Amborella trichopoda]|uniref:Uncharacterized protein n=1 Tax=Amborella trichopoda TaxID=13333 RepID=W1NNE2_AMBTC|nr:hypothetical protein AMTR_s00119p00121220 [Amborella trichopoda]
MVFRFVDLSMEGSGHEEALPMDGKPTDPQMTNSSPPKRFGAKKLVIGGVIDVVGGEDGFKLLDGNRSMAGRDDRGGSAALIDDDLLQLLHGNNLMAILGSMLCGEDGGESHEAVLAVEGWLQRS